MNARTLLLAVVATLPTVVPANAATIGLDLLAARIDPMASGNIRRLDSTVTYAPRVELQIGVAVFLPRGLAMRFSETRGRVPLMLSGAASPAGRSSVLMISRTVILDAVRSRGNLEVSAGMGVLLPVVRNLSPDVSSGSLTLVRASSPDHAALVVNLGTAWRLSPRLRLIADVKYEPYPSTVEVRRSSYPNDDLEANLHLLVVATGISVRF